MLDTSELIVESDEAVKMSGESDEKFRERKDFQVEIVSAIEDKVSEVRKRLGDFDEVNKTARLTGAVFELLAEKQHALELARQDEKREMTELEDDLLDYLRLQAAGTLRRPDMIDIKEEPDSDGIQIVRVVEATTRQLDRRKYLQLRDFGPDLERVLKDANHKDLLAMGYRMLPNVADMIKVSDNLETIVYMPADVDITNQIYYADADGFSNEEWDEFTEEVLPKVVLRKSAFSRDDIRLMVKSLLPYFH